MCPHAFENNDKTNASEKRAALLARLQSDDKEVKAAARKEASAIVNEYIQTKNEKGGGRVRARQAAADVRVDVKRLSALETRELQGYMWPSAVYVRENKKKPPKKPSPRFNIRASVLPGSCSSMALGSEV